MGDATERQGFAAEAPAFHILNVTVTGIQLPLARQTILSGAITQFSPVHWQACSAPELFLVWTRVASNATARGCPSTAG